MKWVIMAVFVCLFAGCNTVGPYDGSVFQLEPTVYMVNVDTWTNGRGYGWPEGSDQLKHDAEIAVCNALRERGHPVESSAFMTFTPYQNGGMGITFVAGDKAGVARWAAFSVDEFREELRKIGLRPLVFKFSVDFRRERFDPE